MTQEELLQVIEQAAKERWRTLDLSGSKLTALPPEIGQLTQLKHLILGKWHYYRQRSRSRRIGNKLNALPPEIGQLTNLKKLWASTNQLSNLPVEIGQLTNLQSLDLSGNQLSSLPVEIGQITNLRSLDLSRNELSNLPAEVVQLTNLRSLDLSRNELSNLPAEVVQLTNLRSLDISSNQLSSLPAEIGQLNSLRSLDLYNNQLSSLPNEISKLTHLRRFYFYNNQLSSLPAEIGQLNSLRSLDLYNNQLSSLPNEISKLTQLLSLSLGNNQLSSFPVEMSQLTKLRMLDFSNNQLSSLPTKIGELTCLRIFCLQNNHLSSLPAEFANFRELEILNLEANQLTSLPVELKHLSQLKTLNLRGNPIPIPPELLGSSWNNFGKPTKILDFYFRTQNPDETELLYEAKLLILGEGGAGKTSLAKKIVDETYKLQDEDTTQGIDVIRWYLKQPNGQDLRVNIWDFGGQEIYHQTHQFFLTERSLYILVADTRKENTDFDYWLNAVRLLSNNSPIFIIKNEKQNRQCEINDRQLRGEFSNLKEIMATNLADNRGLEEIKDAIQLYISRLPHVGTRLPKLWVRVRSVLENYARNNYISLDEYYRLCRLNGLNDQQEMLLLSRYLHDLGVCLHFQTDPLLKKTVILKPEWGTAAVYKVLDNETVRSNLGCFTQDELANIWSDAEYTNMRDELLHLMMRFKLCYEIPGRPHTYIAPNLLSVNQPDYDWDETDNLSLRYEYEFMPKGILTRLIVEMHPWIEQQLVWKNGVVLHKDQTRAEVIEHYNQREIRIRVAGSRKKELLAVVTHELTKIHQSYERLQYDTLVPCNCEKKCRNSQTPYSYPLETLREFLDDREYLIQCQKSRQMVDVRRLIDDVLSQEIETEQKYYLRPDRLPTPAESLQRELEQAREKSLNRQSRQTSIPESVTRDSPSSQFQFDTESDKEVFISYAWGGDSEAIVNQLDQAFQNKGITLVRDKRDLGFKGRIKEFMQRIGRGKCVVVVISEKYLKSENCMYELVQIAKNGEFYDRIFPIVLNDATIYKPIQRLQYIQHWEAQIHELNEAMKTVNAANLQGFRDDIDLYTEIRGTIAGLIDILKDMNTFTPEMHSESGFDELFQAVERKLAE
jgi:internalin A